MFSYWANCDKFGQESLLHIHFTSLWRHNVLDKIIKKTLVTYFFSSSAAIVIIIEYYFFECVALSISHSIII